MSPWAQTGGNPASAGFNRVTALLDRCGLLEEWSGTAGDYGNINLYDTNRGKWRQIWIADNGRSLDYEGAFSDGAMRFEGWTKGPAGIPLRPEAMTRRQSAAYDECASSSGAIP